MNQEKPSPQPFTGVLKDEPAESYHSKREYISSSPLPKMKLSPAHFYEAWKNPSEVSTSSQVRGTFMHTLLLEQDIQKYVPRPLTDKGSLVASNTKAYAEFIAANPGKTPIHPDEYRDAMAILSSACESKTFLRAFEGSDKETSFYGIHEETGLLLKARTDMIAKDFSFILDLKTTSDISRFEKQVFSLDYDVRLIHYRETVRAATGVLVPELYFFAMEQDRPYGKRLYRLGSEAEEAATIKWNHWMNEIKVCIDDQKWPCFEDTIVELARPRYLDAPEISFEGVG